MKIAGIASKEKLIVFCLVVLMQVFSYIPVLRNYLAAPPDRYYFGQTDYPIDMLGNLEIIKDGQLGGWGRVNKISSWPQEIPWYFKYEYLLIGQFAGVLKADPLAMYKIALFVTSCTTLILLYFLLTKIFTKKSSRITAFMLMLFAGGIYYPTENWNDPSMTFRAIGEAVFVFQRFTTVAPHYLLGQVTSLLSIYMLAKIIRGQYKIKYIILMVVFSFLTTVIYAPTMFLVLLSLPFFLLLKSITAFRNSASLITIVPIIGLYVLAALIPVGYIHFLQSSVSDAEKVVLMGLDLSRYLYAVGPVFFLALIPIFLIIKKRDNLLLLLLSVFIAHPLAVLLVQKYHLFSAKRLFQTPYLFVFAVLATIGINTVHEIIIKTKYRIFLRTLFLILTIAVFSTGIYSYQLSLKQGSVCFCVLTPYPYGYPKKEVMEAIWHLRDNSREDDIVLSGLHSGLLIPAFAGNKVYANWWMRLAEPPELGKVWTNIGSFFSGKMSKEEARKFIDDNRIKYVFFSEDERSYATGNKAPSYPFLQNIYQKNNTVIFSVSGS